MLYLNSIIGKGDISSDGKIIIVGFSGVAIFVCLGLLLVFAAVAISNLKSAMSNQSKALFMFVLSALAMILALAAANINLSNLLEYAPKEVSRSASLTEASDLITAENDKVEIKPLTDKQSKYFYYDQDNYDHLENDKTQIFKIEEDTFYNRMYLIDKNNHKSELSEDEKNMIKSKQNK